MLPNTQLLHLLWADDGENGRNGEVTRTQGEITTELDFWPCRVETKGPFAFHRFSTLRRPKLRSDASVCTTVSTAFCLHDFCIVAKVPRGTQFPNCQMWSVRQKPRAQDGICTSWGGVQLTSVPLETPETSLSCRRAMSRVTICLPWAQALSVNIEFQLSTKVLTFLS